MLAHLFGQILHKKQDEPFLHARLNQALDPGLYEELRKNYPDPDLVVRGRKTNPNHLYQVHAFEVIEDKRFASIWREFFAIATSRDWWMNMATLGFTEQGKVGLRYRDRCDIELDCLFGVNTPVAEPSTVKGPHLDNPREIYACLIYFPEDDDHAGGDLIVYEATKENPHFYGKQMTDDVRPIGKVEYEPNHAVFFANGPRALHGVDLRQPTDKWRRYVNIEAEFRRPRFEVK